MKTNAGKAHPMLKAMKVSRQLRLNTDCADGHKFDTITCSQIFEQDATGNTFIFSISLR